MKRIACLAALVAALLSTPAVGARPKVPPKDDKGERAWLAVPEADVEKMVAAIPDKPPVAPQKPRNLLVFYRTDRFAHTVIPHWNKMLELLGGKTGAYKATLSQSYDDLTPERLKTFDAVYFNNTCRMMTPEPVKAALMDFVKGGKGFAGNHGAGDNWQDWPEGLEMLGGQFNGHPFRKIQVKVDDPKSPLTAVFEGKPFPFEDEMYIFKEPYSREKLRILLSIDYENSPDVKQREGGAGKGGKKKAMREDHDYAIAWVRPWGEGRVFFCSFGHLNSVTWDPKIVRFNLAGIQYALGDLKADDTPVPAGK